MEEMELTKTFSKRDYPITVKEIYKKGSKILHLISGRGVLLMSICGNCSTHTELKNHQTTHQVHQKQTRNWKVTGESIILANISTSGTKVGNDKLRTFKLLSHMKIHSK